MAPKLKDIAKLASVTTAGLCLATSFIAGKDKFCDTSDENSVSFMKKTFLQKIWREENLPASDKLIINKPTLLNFKLPVVGELYHVNNVNNIQDEEYDPLEQPVNDSAVRPNEQGRQQQASERLKAAVERSKHMVWAKLYEAGVPGLVIAVSVDGKMTWKHGFGYADVENRVLANSGTVMRIASISKSITTAAVAKLWEDGLLDLDKPVSEYVETWPKHHPPITTRQLLSHLGGIRHYERELSTNKGGDKDLDKNTTSNNAKEPEESTTDVKNNHSKCKGKGSIQELRGDLQ